MQRLFVFEMISVSILLTRKKAGEKCVGILLNLFIGRKGKDGPRCDSLAVGESCAYNPGLSFHILGDRLIYESCESNGGGNSKLLI